MLRLSDFEESSLRILFLDLTSNTPTCNLQLLEDQLYLTTATTISEPEPSKLATWPTNHRPTNKCRRNPQVHPTEPLVAHYKSREAVVFHPALDAVWRMKPESCLKAGLDNTIPRSTTSSLSTREPSPPDRSGITPMTTRNISAHLPRKRGKGCKRLIVRPLLQS